MRKIEAGIFILVFLLAMPFMLGDTWAEENPIGLSLAKILSHKKVVDDPSPLFKDLPLDGLLPADVIKNATYDVEEMKALWSDIVGLKSPDLVGKIAPEIKEGSYTVGDKEKYPFKDLMYPVLYNRFNPGGPPHVGNFSQVEIVPTTQRYWATPISKATKENIGKTQLDDAGYIKPETYVAGYPFPRPSGQFKAQQIMYNWENSYDNGEAMVAYAIATGYNARLKQDFEGIGIMTILRLQGRVLSEPYGWFDNRAEAQGERSGTNWEFLSPRDDYGNILSTINYADPERLSHALIWVNVLRRVRKFSTTDTQDPVSGSDSIYDSAKLFSQKLSPNSFPWDYEVLDEREYLMPYPKPDGSRYLDTSSTEIHNIVFERRPIYVVQLTQKDPNYVYGKRVLYFDKESFLLLASENYDQKGRLYRSGYSMYLFEPAFGLPRSAGQWGADFVDTHSMVVHHYSVPLAYWLSRDQISLRTIVYRGK